MPSNPLSNTLNIVFAGTPNFAAIILKSLLEKQHNIKAIYSQPDRKAGRGRKLSPTAVKRVALDYNELNKANINIEQPLDFKKSNPDYTNNINILKNFQPDLIIVVAYGLILPQEVLDIPKYGCINIHASLLPKWRGAAPIQRAILAGDTETGIAIQQMDKGLDTGDILSESKCEITQQDTTISLSEKLINLAIPLLITTLENIKNHKISLTKQDNALASYAHKITKSESIIDFNNSAIDIDRLIRAFTPWPGAAIKLQDTNIKILEANVIKDLNKNQDDNLKTPGTIMDSSRNGIIIQCQLDKLNITLLQFSGGKPITAADALNGKYKELLKTGTILV